MNSHTHVKYETTVNLKNSSLLISDVTTVLERLREVSSAELHFDKDKLPDNISVEFIIGQGYINDLWELRGVVEELRATMPELTIDKPEPAPSL